MEMCSSLVHPLNSESQQSTDHTYVRAPRSPGACSRSSPANERSPPYNSHQGSINFLFLCLQQCIKRGALHQCLCLYSRPHPLLPLLLFRLMQEVCGGCGGWRYKNAASFLHHEPQLIWRSWRLECRCRRCWEMFLNNDS